MSKTYLVVSDLHLEHWPDGTDSVVADRLRIAASGHNAVAIVVAGDVHPIERDRERFFDRCRSMVPDVVTVMGNHDWYGRVVGGASAVTTAGPPSVVGATLWTDFNGRDEATMRLAETWVNDFRTIRSNRRRSFLSAGDMADIHDAERELLDRDGSPIIVTHFPPTTMSIAPAFAKSGSINRYFCNALPFNMQMGRTLWVCGHTHWPHAYWWGDCLVVCNPLGYPGENHVDPKSYVPIAVTVSDDGGEVENAADVIERLTYLGSVYRA